MTQIFSTSIGSILPIGGITKQLRQLISIAGSYGIKTKLRVADACVGSQDKHDSMQHQRPISFVLIEKEQFVA